MSVINANPTVYDVSLLPSRQSKKKEISLVNIEDLELYKLSLNNRDDDLITSDQSSTSSYSSLSINDDDDSEYLNEDDDEPEEEIDSLEIYDLISNISDPEHPLSLAALGVVNLSDINIEYYDPSKMGIANVIVKITPTINHCSLASLIGLGIRVRLERCLPPRFRITILLKEGSHQSEGQVNKQLNDKERISAACENSQLLSVISTMLASCD